MDQNTRNTLRNVVTQCRRLLEESVAQVLQGQFGVYAAGKKDEVQIELEARMSHLSEEDRAYRQDLLDHYEHIKALGYKAKDALAQLIREVAFTHLNRFCAYRMMESRGLIRESVSKGLKSQGFLFYLADHEEDERWFNTGQQDVAYRHFLNWLGGTLSEEIGVLFAPTDPANRLYPPQRVIDQVLGLLNDPELVGIWSEDEAIGWVYQYFTPKELRDQARKESQAPRNSYELAFRNQFFTPRYVVEFLTDNTLGRIWYEMRQGNTRLKDQCRYMVGRPTEVFLKDGEAEPTDVAKASDDLSQEELLKLPVYVPFRAKKDPRELRILDPACGSGHFLLYCFDLLLTIYEEAYGDPDLGPALKKDYPTLEDLRRDVPRLILAHNLHGIDIDPRASQIAALALWLRCQRAYQGMGIKQDRPKITRSNIVCAEPMPGDDRMLKEFIDTLQPRLLGQIVEAVFSHMQLAGEAGPLLTIEDDIRESLTKAHEQWQATGGVKQRTMFDLATTAQLSLNFKGITDASFFDVAEGLVLDALKSFAEAAHSDTTLTRRLFVEDTASGFALVDSCRKRYDTILMNPPFGVCSTDTEQFFRSRYKSLANDIYVLFLHVFSGRLAPGGALGALTSRGFMVGRDQRSFRPLLLGAGKSQLALLLDLGLDVLDTAAVETAAYVLVESSYAQLNKPAVFLDARNLPRPQLDSLLLCLDEVPTYRRSLTRFTAVPDTPLAYTATDEEITGFSSGNLLEPTFGKVTKGLSSGDDERFLRLMWEVAPSEIGVRWKFCAKGADYLWLVTNITAVVDWGESGAAIREYTASVSTNVAQAYRSSRFYYQPALTYTYRCNDFSLRALPEGCLFTNSAPVIVCRGNAEPVSHLVPLLAVFMSQRYEKLLSHVSKKGKYDTGRMGKLPAPTLPSYESITDQWRKCCEAVMQKEAQLEVSPYFVCYRHLMPPQCDETEWTKLLTDFATASGLVPSERFIARAVRGYDERYRIANGWAHSIISYLLGVACGRWDVRMDTSTAVESAGLKDAFEPLAKYPPGALVLDGIYPAPSVPPNYPLRVVVDGILPDDTTHPDDVVSLLRNGLHFLAGKGAAEVEQAICDAFGSRDIRDVLRRPGQNGVWSEHIKRYTSCLRKAPIYWLLQSSKKNYAIWLYYHRLDKDILFKALVNYVEPKIRLETDRLDSLRSQKGEGGTSKATKKLDKEIEKQEEFLSELRDFEEKLRRAAELRLEPDLNDGVVLNIAPLHELVPWKEAEKYWEELLEGKYEWSSIGKQLREKGLVK